MQKINRLAGALGNIFCLIDRRQVQIWRIKKRNIIPADRCHLAVLEFYHFHGKSMIEVKTPQENCREKGQKYKAG